MNPEAYPAILSIRMSESEAKKFRRNVAIVVVNYAGEILACHRSDREGAWQLPQGGIEESEVPLEAMYRELQEEIGTADVEVIGQLPNTIRYDWPETLFHRGFHGQEQTYFLVRLNSSAIINLKPSQAIPEFDRFEWLGPEEFKTRVSSFKRDAYIQALEELIKLFPGIIAVEI